MARITNMRRCLKCGRKREVYINPNGLCDFCIGVMLYLTDPRLHDEAVEHLRYFY